MRVRPFDAAVTAGIGMSKGDSAQAETGIPWRVGEPNLVARGLWRVLGCSCGILDKKNVQHVDIVQLAIADVNECWNHAAQVQQGMQLDGRLGGTKRRPVEQAQT